MARQSLIWLLLVGLATFAGAGEKRLTLQNATIAADDLSGPALVEHWAALTASPHPFLLRADRPLPASLPGLHRLAAVPPDAWIVSAEKTNPAPPPGLAWCDAIPPEAKLTARAAWLTFPAAVLVRRDRQPLAKIVLDNKASLQRLAADPAVWLIDAAPPARRPANDNVRALTGAEFVQQPPFGLTGQGVTLGICDEGKVRHADFTGRLTNLRQAKVGEHATHVCGTMAGDGSLTDGLYRGLAPAAALYAWDFADPTADFPQVVESNVQWLNNSWVYYLADSEDNCEYLGAYDAFTAEYDRLIVGEYGRTVGVVFAAGNMADQNDCGIVERMSYGSLPPPGTAKNVLTVGATNGRPKISTYSGRGPTLDGRLKPDLISIGCVKPDPGYINSTLPGDEYGGPGWCGTSMASPQLTGGAALLLETAAANGVWLDPAAVKALLIAGARDWDDPGPNYDTGWGQMDLTASVILLRYQGFRQGSVAAEKQAEILTFTVPEGWPAVEATLVWDDPVAAETAEYLLVNDLDLRLVDPAGTVHRPWILDPEDPDEPAVRGDDSINNVERVRVDDPLPGEWEVRVRADRLQVEQAYTLAGWIFGDLSCDADADRSPGAQCGGNDCRDDDASVYPGAPELCATGFDEDCDGETDENCEEETPSPTPEPDDDDQDDEEDESEDGCGC